MPLAKRLLCYLMAAFYFAAGINHFWHPGFYLNIMPRWLPAHEELVALSGVAEIMLGILLLIPRYRHLAAWSIILMLVIFLAVHIDMICNAERFPGISLWVLWLRLPLQGVFIAWAYWYTQRGKPDVTALK